MSVNAELAHAARRVRAANERLDEPFDLGHEWSALLSHVHRQPDYRARKAIDEWAAAMEDRIARRLLHSPLRLKDDQ